MQYTGWTFFHINFLQNCIDVCLKKPKTNEKEAGDGPFNICQFNSLNGLDARIKFYFYFVSHLLKFGVMSQLK